MCLRSNVLLQEQKYDFETMRRRLADIRKIGYCYISARALFRINHRDANFCPLEQVDLVI